jgi:energy-converting hydrogenase A subunit R
MRKFAVFFDLEGPLCIEDVAYEICIRKLKDGRSFFEKVSLYDDILTSQRKDYQPGTTLVFILPFLLAEDITESDIYDISNSTNLVNGAEDLINKLKDLKINIGLISTSYQQHAYNIAAKLKIPQEFVACTRLPLLDFKITKEEKNLIKTYKERILQTSLENLKQTLDDIFYSKLYYNTFVYKDILKKVKVIGGRYKLESAKEFIKKLNIDISNVAVVGDSITDAEMLKGIKEEGGLSIAFNANEYALPYAKVAVASLSIYDILSVIEVWISKKDLTDLVKKNKNIHLMDRETNLNQVLALHKEKRREVRGLFTAKLG